MVLEIRRLMEYHSRRSSDLKIVSKVSERMEPSIWNKMKKPHQSHWKRIPWIFILLICLFGLKLHKVNAQILDSRCYLEGGGSAESFLASEDIAVGAVVGKLRINGNTNVDTGDIKLSLRERDSPVEIAVGSKDLVLKTPLDKEGLHGPASVYVNVICDRRHSTDPSFVIPVNIRVTDVNDNAPQWIGAPYSLSLSEVTVPRTRILQGAKAVDIDGPGPFSTVEYSVLPGPHSDIVDFVSPLEGTLILRKPLDYETLKNFTIKLRAQDHGTPPKFSDTTLRVQITDADDQNPKFLRTAYQAFLPIDGRPTELKILPEPIRAVDQDEGLRAPIQFSITQSLEARFFKIHPRSGTLSLIAPINPLDFPNTVTLVIKATQVDNPDRYALATLTVTRHDSPVQAPGVPLAYVQSRFTVKVREDLGVGSRILQLNTNRPGRGLRFHITDPLQEQYFSVGNMGEIVLKRQLDFENRTRHQFDVMVGDGTTNSTTTVVVEVLDVNDWEPRFRKSHYEFVVPKEMATAKSGFNEPLAVGRLEAADGDRDDKLRFELKGQMAEMFNMDARGVLWLRSGKPNVSVVNLIATATDNGIPSRSSSVPVSVTMEGVQLAHTGWAPSVLTAFAIIMCLFVVTIMGMCIYIYKGKLSKGRNRIHSQAHSTTTLMTTNDKKLGKGNAVGPGPNMTIGNPISNMHSGSISSLSNGTNMMDRDVQRERDNYTATVRSIISRAAAKNGHIYKEEDDQESLANSDSQQPNYTTVQRNKKLSWVENEHGNGLGNSVDSIPGTENNLTVYF